MHLSTIASQYNGQYAEHLANMAGQGPYPPPQPPRKPLPLWALAVVAAVAQVLALTAQSPAPSPIPSATPAAVHATVPCGWLVDRVKLRHGGKLPRAATPELVGELYTEALKLHGLDPKPGKTVQATRLQFLEATADVLGCFAL